MPGGADARRYLLCLQVPRSWRIGATPHRRGTTSAKPSNTPTLRWWIVKPQSQRTELRHLASVYPPTPAPAVGGVPGRRLLTAATGSVMRLAWVALSRAVKGSPMLMASTSYRLCADCVHASRHSGTGCPNRLVDSPEGCGAGLHEGTIHRNPEGVTPPCSRAVSAACYSSFTYVVRLRLPPNSTSPCRLSPFGTIFRI